MERSYRLLLGLQPAWQYFEKEPFDAGGGAEAAVGTGLESLGGGRWWWQQGRPEGRMEPTLAAEGGAGAPGTSSAAEDGLRIPGGGGGFFPIGGGGPFRDAIIDAEDNGRGTSEFAVFRRFAMRRMESRSARRWDGWTAGNLQVQLLAGVLVQPWMGASVRTVKSQDPIDRMHRGLLAAESET